MTLAAAVPTTADPTHGENRAAVHAQRVVRGFLGRLAAVRKANLIYEKIFDPRTQGYYYYNTKTFETTWNVRGCVLYQRSTVRTWYIRTSMIPRPMDLCAMSEV